MNAKIISPFFLLFGLISFAIGQAGSWNFTINVSDGSVNQNIFLGVDPNGTDGVDTGLDSLAPPPPPAGNFDARFLDILGAGNEKFRDVRNNQLTQKIFKVKYQVSSGNGPIVLAWDQNLAAQLTTEMYIRDDINGALFGPYDMRTNSSLDVSTGSGLLDDKLRIYMTPAVTSDIESVYNNQNIPKDFELNIYPNPFNPSTTISYNIAQTDVINMTIYNILGQVVTILVNEVKLAGKYQVRWNGADQSGKQVAAGLFILKVNSNRHSEFHKLILMK